MNSRFESFTPGLLGRYPIARFIFICNIPHFVDIWYELLISVSCKEMQNAFHLKVPSHNNL
ncbi:hypothetical protein T01_1191 [Trichinella spiralis]|uniref:Uncharacterized protein n=1 Tax=Trichinella spiralis TaxID=6334 RepID=A0A0V1B3V2_TRISP|nr:hypothetical protein T01_1191 [Trichinella spiralis]